MKKLYAMMTICLIFVCFVSSVTAADTSHKTHEKNHSQPSEKMNHEAGAGTFEQQMVDKQIRGEFQIMSLASMNMKALRWHSACGFWGKRSRHRWSGAD